MKIWTLSFLTSFFMVSSSFAGLIPWDWRVAFSKNIGCKVKPCTGSYSSPDAPSGKKIALTFDDGPSSIYTPQILEILDKHRAKATFFILGKNIEGNQDLIREIYRKGHLIGNHSWNHPSFWSLNKNEIDVQVWKTDRALFNIGVRSEYFRFPNGNSNQYTLDMLKSKGYKVVGWNVDTCDWGFNKDGVLPASSNKICNGVSATVNNAPEYLLQKVTSKGGGIILMHDVQKITASNLDWLMTQLEQQGFEFVLLDDKRVFPLLNE
jgi:peptidoglycan-N-acetylglucosamine deacetylase